MSPVPTQSPEALSQRARERNRDKIGRFDVEGRQASQVDLPGGGSLALAQSSDDAGKPIHLKGSLGRKNSKKNPTKHQIELEQAIKKVFAAGGWNEVLKMRRRRGFHHYSISNRWRIARHSIDIDVDTPVVASRSDWEKKGRRIVEGSHGCPVMVPRHYTKEVEEEDENGDTVTKKVRGMYFRIGNGTEVYDITQTEPIPGEEDTAHTQIWDSVNHWTGSGPPRGPRFFRASNPQGGSVHPRGFSQ